MRAIQAIVLQIFLCSKSAIVKANKPLLLELPFKAIVIILNILFEYFITQF